jgi:hypothetical protein
LLQVFRLCTGASIKGAAGAFSLFIIFFEVQPVRRLRVGIDLSCGDAKSTSMIHGVALRGDAYELPLD